jgi:hypothetical protein
LIYQQYWHVTPQQMYESGGLLHTARPARARAAFLVRLQSFVSRRNSFIDFDFLIFCC